MITGFCQNCGQYRPLEEVQTIRLPNFVYVHEGRCTFVDRKTKKTCGGRAFVTVKDRDLIITDSGHKFPREVYVGKDTPKRLINDLSGQVLIKADGTRTETVTDETKIISVEDKKKEEQIEKNIKSVR